MRVSLTTKLCTIIFIISLFIISSSTYFSYLAFFGSDVPRSCAENQLQPLSYIGFNIISASFILTLLVAFFLSHWLGYSFAKFQDGVEKVCAGDFDTVIELNSNDELRALADSFNSMVVAVRDRIQTLTTKNDTLQRIDKLKEEIVTNTSYELRTSLHGMIEISESLIDSVAGQLSDAQMTNLDMIVKTCIRLSTLVNDILNSSRLKHKRLELHIQPIKMSQLTNVVLALAQPLIGDKSLQLINAIPPNTPQVEADENRVQQILYNLVSNAIKFTDAGSVEVSANVVDEQLEITVADTGIGIPTDQLDRVFELFEQADSSNARERGIGLGLAITKQLVKLHGGKLRVESTVGQGSRFTFTLPLSQSEQKMPVMPVQQSKPPRQSQDEPILQDDLVATIEALTLPAGKFKILVVDDEPINLQVLANRLSPHNYCLTQASNEMQAIAEIEQGFKPDLIILDIRQKCRNASDTCKTIFDYFSETELPIILLTTKNKSSKLIEGLSYGTNDYSVKPITKSEFLSCVRTHIQLCKINAAYGRFVPHELLRILGHDSIVNVKLGDHVRKEMTILFSDIRSFMTLSEKMLPEENFNFINAYLKRVVPTIRKHNGFIDKYIGDAVMAVFPKTAEDALLAAIDMQKQVALYNAQRVEQGEMPINIGIGLHKGSLMLGTIGEEKRMEGTVISDAVNVASRLEGLSKIYGVPVIFSEKILMDLKDPTKYNYRFLGKVPVKGRKDAISVFESFDGESPESVELKLSNRKTFEWGIYLYYSRKFAEGYQVFKSVLQKNPRDKAALFYLKRCKTFHKQGILGEWNDFKGIGNKV